MVEYSIRVTIKNYFESMFPYLILCNFNLEISFISKMKKKNLITWSPYPFTSPNSSCVRGVRQVPWHQLLRPTILQLSRWVEDRLPLEGLPGTGVSNVGKIVAILATFMANRSFLLSTFESRYEATPSSFRFGKFSGKESLGDFLGFPLFCLTFFWNYFSKLKDCLN